MQINSAMLSALLVLWTATADGQIVYEKGRAIVNYSGKAASPTNKEEAAQMAEGKAIEAYYAEAGESAMRNYDSVREKILGNVDSYIIEKIVVSEEDDKSSKQYAVTIRAKLNLAALSNVVTANSAVANVAQSARSKLTFLFVARQENTETAYDAHVYKREDIGGKSNGMDSRTDRGDEGESISKSQVKTNSSRISTTATESHKASTVEQGGSTTRRASEVTWRLFPSANLNSVFTGSFGNAGFRVIEAANVEPYTGGKLRVAAVQDDYKTGLDLQSQTLADVVAGLRIAQIPYLAFGTLDVGFANQDPATGLLRVVVTVNAKILDVSGVVPENVASVGPIQYAGLGTTEIEAQTSALKLAAQNACRELISILTNAGIH